MNETDLVSFKAIVTFVQALAEIYGEKIRPLQLYSHLINKTTVSHDKAIQKHLTAFREFCTTNRDAFTEKNAKKLQTTIIRYSPKVYIDMEQVFKDSDRETAGVVWSHLLTISALVDPTGKARDILKNSAKTAGSTNAEMDFFTDIMAKVEDKVDPNATPMEAISAIVNSGMLTDIFSNMNEGIKNGDINMGRMMGSLQNMMSTLKQDESPENPAPNLDLSNMMGALSGMLGSAGNTGQHTGQLSGENPQMNLAAMMGPMMSMLGTMNMGNIPPGMNTSRTVEEHIDMQLQEAKDTGNIEDIN